MLEEDLVKLGMQIITIASLSDLQTASLINIVLHCQTVVVLSSLTTAVAA